MWETDRVLLQPDLVLFIEDWNSLFFSLSVFACASQIKKKNLNLEFLALGLKDISKYDFLEV